MFPTSSAILLTPATISGFWERLVYPLQVRTSKASGLQSQEMVWFFGSALVFFSFLSFFLLIEPSGSFLLLFLIAQQLLAGNHIRVK